MIFSAQRQRSPGRRMGLCQAPESNNAVSGASPCWADVILLEVCMIYIEFPVSYFDQKLLYKINYF